MKPHLWLGRCWPSCPVQEPGLGGRLPDASGSCLHGRKGARGRPMAGGRGREVRRHEYGFVLGSTSKRADRLS